MKKKHLVLIIVGLIILYVVTVSVLLLKPQNNGESVATIGDDSISRQEWLNEMEAIYGESTLKDLIDQKVIEQMAKKYDIKVNDKEIDRELRMLKTSAYSQGQYQNEEKLKQQIKFSLLLEELLTKDAVISNKEIEKYYQQNKGLFTIPTSYHLSQIIVDTKKEAEQTIDELKQGSSFSVLAMERSIDEFSANQGGDIGFVNEEEESVSPEVLMQIKQLKKDGWTKPIKVADGYAIFLLHERVPEKKYSYKDVKNQIRRQLALEQMDIPVTADIFWNEADVEWFYGNKKD
ncbi:peptidyl-prolyl cis-trans isomerase [Neobacillus sp. LXY-4]|uniref:peptidyl-prolyl cis-trans isomerase n=1 Tax=Neobacillus sp. LXY-4 TaxID=3379826 RepID=UPI003EE2D04C